MSYLNFLDKAGNNFKNKMGLVLIRSGTNSATGTRRRIIDMQAIDIKPGFLYGQDNLDGTISLYTLKSAFINNFGQSSLPANTTLTLATHFDVVGGTGGTVGNGDGISTSTSNTWTAKQIFTHADTRAAITLGESLAIPSPSANGDIYNSAQAKGILMNNNGALLKLGYTLEKSRTTVQISASNTTSPVDLSVTTLQTGFWQTGRTNKFNWLLRYSTTTGTNNITLEMLHGTNSLGTCTLNLPASTTDGVIDVNASFSANNIVPPGTFALSTIGYAVAVAPTSGTPVGASFSGPGGKTSDLSIGQNLILRATWSVANASNSIQTRLASQTIV